MREGSTRVLVELGALLSRLAQNDELVEENLEIADRPNRSISGI